MVFCLAREMWFSVKSADFDLENGFWKLQFLFWKTTKITKFWLKSRKIYIKFQMFLENLWFSFKKMRFSSQKPVFSKISSFQVKTTVVFSKICGFQVNNQKTPQFLGKNHDFHSKITNLGSNLEKFTEISNLPLRNRIFAEKSKTAVFMKVVRFWKWPVIK